MKKSPALPGFFVCAIFALFCHGTGRTLLSMSHATDMLTLYQDAEKKILEGQRVFWGERRLYRADLGEVRRGVLYWERRVAREQQVAAGGTPGAAVADFSDGQASSRNPNGPWVSG